jgi:hypothetical protein
MSLTRKMQSSYKVERMIASTGFWYEVMLSPFNTWEEAANNIEKYRHFYPCEEQNYKITFQKK